MEIILKMWPYILPFLFIITILVFVHELGHYLVARKNGIKVETFSIGLGPEVFGWTDKVGTRWKVSLLPLGGYVRMFGDHDESSRPSTAVREMSFEEKQTTLHGKSVWQRIAVSIAGPAFNYLFAILLLIVLFSTVGQKYIPAVVADVTAGSPAAKAGLKSGDKIVKVGDKEIENFTQLQNFVRNRPGEPLHLIVERQESIVSVDLVPEATEVKDIFGKGEKIGVLGVLQSGQILYKKVPFAQAILKAFQEAFSMSASMLQGLWQIILGKRSVDELSGILRIAKVSGDMIQSGWINFMWLAVFLSINLGLINLLPIPMLDGGHVFFYLIEAIRGKPLSEKAQEYAFRLGFSLVIGLMLLSFWNDLIHLGAFEWLRKLFS